jgi:hypothetical protein
LNPEHQPTGVPVVDAPVEAAPQAEPEPTHQLKDPARDRIEIIENIAPPVEMVTQNGPQNQPLSDALEPKTQALTTQDGARQIPSSELPAEHDPDTVECPVCQYKFKPGDPRL